MKHGCFVLLLVLIGHEIPTLVEGWIGLRTVLNCMIYNKKLSMHNSFRELFLDDVWLHQQQGEVELVKNGSLNEKLASYEQLSFEYHFRNINYEQGIRQIHSPEHIEAVQKNHLWSVFRIINTTEPLQKDNFVSVAIQCKIMGVKDIVHIAMYTSKRDESHYRIFYGSPLKRASIHLYVKPTHDFMTPLQSGSKGISLSRGHILKMDIEFDKIDLVWHRYLANFLKTSCILEDNILWAYDFPRTRHNEKLAKYRRLVLFYYKTPFEKK